MKRKLDIIGVGLANTDMAADFDSNTAILQDISFSKGEYTPLSANDFNLLFSSMQNFRIFPGGSVANTIRNLSLFGINAGFCGLTGDDENGKLFTDNLLKLGIKPFMQTASNINSRICIVLIHNDGERTMFGQKGTLQKIHEDLITPLPETTYLMIEGSVISENPKLLNVIKNTNSKIFLTLSGMRKDKINLPWFFETLPCVHILFGNESEYDAINFKNMKIPNICVKTLGINGCEIYMNGKWRHYDPIRLEKSQIINTTGAGDAFAAGFIYAFIKKYPLHKIVDIANKASARVLKNEVSYL